MANRGFPTTQADNIEDKDFVGRTISDSLVIASDGKPANINELHERIERFFQKCIDGNLRPGYELLALCLGVSRVTVWHWRRGEGCTEEWRAEIERASRVIDSFLEQSLVQGKISPPSGIFLMKNWLGYSDTISIENSVMPEEKDRRRTADEIAAAHGVAVEQSKQAIPTATFVQSNNSDENHHDILDATFI